MVRASPEERQTQVLDAAQELFVRFGYDKTTIADIAREAGVGKGTVYLYFSGKDDILEALLLRELQAFSEAWFETLMLDPEGGTLGGMYKAMLGALSESDFMAAILMRDRSLLGNYLKKPGNVFQKNASGQMTRYEVVGMLQKAGAVRDDVDAKVIAHIMNMFSYGMVSLDGVIPAEQIPATDELIDGIAEIMDRALKPEHPNASAAGKAVLKEIFEAGRQHFKTMAQYRAEQKKGSSS